MENSFVSAELEKCQEQYIEGNFSEALEWLAQAVKLSPDMGPQEILEQILKHEDGRAVLLKHYSFIMYYTLKANTTLGKGMYKAWKLLDIDPVLGKRTVTKLSPNAAVYPYCIIYLNSARCQCLAGESGKANFKIAESGAFVDKKDLMARCCGLAIMMERYAYTLSRIGSADVNKILDLLEELLEEDIPYVFRTAFDELPQKLEDLKLYKNNINRQKRALLQMAERLPLEEGVNEKIVNEGYTRNSTV